MSPKVKTISYVELVNSLLANLSDREREVLQKRNALAEFPKHTLEQIGNDYNITRERVRQIEKEGLRKITSLDFAKEKIGVSDLETIVLEFLKEYGGLMAEYHLKEKLLLQQIEAEEKSLDFILANILANKLKRTDSNADHYVIWHLEDTDLDQVINVASALKTIIEGHAHPIDLSDLEDQFKSHELYSYIDELEAKNEAVFQAILRLRKDVNKNILNQWGLYNWTTIKPKRMTDKAYLIMLRENRPLHFAEVADLINQASFDRKKACPATVHNELILDDKYVLVGRGIYALRDWGYEEGTVADIITNILKNKGPLTKKEITEAVLDQRLVQKTTITLALMNKKKFNRLEDGRYEVV